MNYLAHLFLAQDTPESLIGNLLGDFAKGSVECLYTVEIRKGIELHRRVDTYTDAHHVFRSSKRLIAKPRSKFSGIMIDVFYDHFLARHWSEYSDIALDDFASRVYKILVDNHAILPEALRQIVPRMKAYNLLVSYQEIQGIDTALKRIATRIKWQNTLGDGIEDLLANYQQIEADFCVFFPELINYVKTYSYQK